jgi:DNA repair protein RadC
MKSLKDIKPSQRPRRMLLDRGVDVLNFTELWSVFLGSGIRQYDVNAISHSLARMQDMILTCETQDLLKIKGIGVNKALSIIAAREIFLRLSAEKSHLHNTKIDSPSKAAYFFLNISKSKKEYLICLYLNSQKHLIKRELISIGTLDSNVFHPREVFFPAVKRRASFIVLGHNHPSGVMVPSSEDIFVTDQLKKAGNLLGIKVLDHIIISRNKWRSIISNSSGRIL